MLADPGVERRMVGGLDGARLLGGALGELDDRVDHRLEAAVAEHHGAEHVVLGQLLGLRLDHQHRVAGAGDDEVELRLGHLVELRVEHEGAVDQADAGAADRAHEGHAGEGEGGGGRDHARRCRDRSRGHATEDGGDDLGLAAEALGEERADRAVDEARGQRLLLARPALALEEAAGDLARGEGLLLVVHGEREEVDARLFGAWRRRRWRAPRSRHRWRARRRRPGGRCGRFPERADGPPSRSRHVGCRTWFIPFHTSDGREGEPWARRREASSGFRRKRPAILPWPFFGPSMVNAAAPCRRVSVDSGAPSAAVRAARSARGSAPRRSC